MIALRPHEYPFIQNRIGNKDVAKSLIHAAHVFLKSQRKAAPRLTIIASKNIGFGLFVFEFLANNRFDVSAHH